MALSTFFKWAGGGVAVVIAVLCLSLQCAYWYGASLLPKDLPQPRRAYPTTARVALWRMFGGGDTPLSVRKLTIFSYAGLGLEFGSQAMMTSWMDRYAPLPSLPADLRLLDVAAGSLHHQIEQERSATEAKGTVSSGNAEALRQIGYDHHLKEVAAYIRVSRERSAESMADFVLEHGHYGRGSEGLDQAARVYFGADVDALTDDELLALATLRFQIGSMDPYCQPEQFRERYVELIRHSAASGLPRASDLSLPRLKPTECSEPQ